MLFFSLIVIDFSLLPHGSMKVQGQASYGGCRADIHSPTMFSAQARHVTGKISAWPVDVTWAVLLVARDGAIPLSHELCAHGQGAWLGDSMQCWHPPQLLAPWGSGPCLVTKLFLRLA